MYMDQLVKIYNTLLTVSTKGEDTLTMAECLKALRQTIMEMSSIPDEMTLTNSNEE